MIVQLIPSKPIIDFTQSWEKFSAVPYLDATGNWTIGFGNTRYENGKRVSSNDPSITLARGVELFTSIYIEDSKAVLSLLKVNVSQDNFNALCDFDYNKGTPRLAGSHLLIKVNANPKDPSIADEFNKWVYSEDQHTGQMVKLPGLVTRAANLVDIYFNGKYVNHN